MVSSPGMAMVLPCRSFSCHRLAGDDHRAVLSPMLLPQLVRAYVGDIWIGVDGNGGDFQFAAHGPLVERLDVLQNVLEAVRPGSKAVFGKPVRT